MKYTRGADDSPQSDALCAQRRSATCLSPLNPATNKTFELLDDLLTDLTGGRWRARSWRL
jgi:hypothetical protein